MKRLFALLLCALALCAIASPALADDALVSRLAQYPYVTFARASDGATAQYFLAYGTTPAVKFSGGTISIAKQLTVGNANWKILEEQDGCIVTGIESAGGVTKYMFYVEDGQLVGIEPDPERGGQYVGQYGRKSEPPQPPVPETGDSAQPVLWLALAAVAAAAFVTLNVRRREAY